jgi:hypothetical protein
MLAESYNYFDNSNGYSPFNRSNYGYRIVNNIYGRAYDGPDFTGYPEEEE